MSIISSPAESQSLIRKSISDITVNTSTRISSSATRLRRRTHHLNSTTSSSLRHSAGESSNTDDDFEDSEGSNSCNSRSNANFLRKSPKLKSWGNRRKCDRKSTKFQDCNKSSNSIVNSQEMTMKRSDSPSIVSIPFERTQMSMTLSLPLSSSAATSSSSISMSDLSSHHNPLNNINQNNLGVNSLYKLNSSRDINRRKRNFSSCDKINEMQFDDGNKRQKCADSDNECSIRQSPIVNKLLVSVKHWDHSQGEKMSAKQSLDLNVVSATARDSGFSSCGSSQELSPVITNDFCSQETYCAEIETQLSAAEPDSQDTVDGVDFISSASHELGSIKSTDSNLTTHSSMSDDIHDDRDSLMMSHNTPLLSSSYVQSSSQYYTDSETLTSSKLSHTFSDTGGAAPIINSDSSFTQCMMCLIEPKNGVFVHNNFLHLCCCYKCAMKVWAKSKRCPVCNCKVKNVMKLYVH